MLFCLCFASTFAGSCFACVLHQAIGEVPFAGSCFACVLHQALGELPFAGSCFACVLHQVHGETPFAGSCFACALHQAIGELPFAGSCFACVLHQALGKLPFAGSCFACALHQAIGELPFAAIPRTTDEFPTSRNERLCHVLRLYSKRAVSKPSRWKSIPRTTFVLQKSSFRARPLEEHSAYYACTPKEQFRSPTPTRAFRVLRLYSKRAVSKPSHWKSLPSKPSKITSKIKSRSIAICAHAAPPPFHDLHCDTPFPP